MKKLLALSLLNFTLSGCSLFLDNLPYVYSPDIQQGNRIDQDMINQLRPNMTKKQVIYIMGSPMLVDYFHQDRWNYIYSAKLNGEEPVQKSLSIFFENDKVKSIQGDFKPNSKAVKKLTDQTVDVPKRDLDKTLWEMMTGLVESDTKKDREPEKQINDSLF